MNQNIWHRGGTTCVDVMYDAVERLGRIGAGMQERWKFLEQFLYLGWESDNGGCGLGLILPSRKQKGSIRTLSNKIYGQQHE
jgi:hypothetical protein